MQSIDKKYLVFAILNLIFNFNSMAQQMPKLDFLVEYILALLEENKINLTEEQQKVYVPQILSQVELRLGLEIFPKLNDAQKNEFTKLMNNANTTADQWKNFWFSSVPTFEEDVKKVLMNFSDKVRQILA